MQRKPSDCSVQDCQRPTVSRGLCRYHYTNWWRHGDPVLAPKTREQRFWAKVQKTETCWLWTGSKTPNGYPVFWNGKIQEGSHRYAYELLVGPIPAGLHIDHLCRNPGCVNPAHLEPVTQRENTMRSPIAPAALNAAKTHCKRGHPFDDENTYVVMRNGRPIRSCRICRRGYKHGLVSSESSE
jgi:hypothetical protein